MKQRRHRALRNLAARGDTPGERQAARAALDDHGDHRPRELTCQPHGALKVYNGGRAQGFGDHLEVRPADVRGLVLDPDSPEAKLWADVYARRSNDGAAAAARAADEAVGKLRARSPEAAANRRSAAARAAGEKLCRMTGHHHCPACRSVSAAIDAGRARCMACGTFFGVFGA